MRKILWNVAAGLIDGVGGAARPHPPLNILIYHGVGDRPDPLGHCDVDRERFETHLKVLSQAFTVLPLGDAVSRLRDGSLPPRATCITFDDGYANNHDVALPLLERYGLTATFFIATAYLDGGRMFNDVVIEAVRRTSLSNLDLRDLGLGLFDLTTQQSRIDALADLLPRVKTMTLDARDEQAHAIARAAQVDLGPSLMMTREQVRTMSSRGMEVGGHTHRHPILNSVTDSEAEHEIQSGKSELEAITGKPVTVFAYPNGRPETDYSRRHAQMVREAGFVAGVSTAKGCARSSHDPYQLPRFTPWDRAAESFLCRLAFSRRKFDTAEAA